VTRGADIKCKPTPLPNIADILCLNCCYRSKGAEYGRDDQYSHDGCPRLRISSRAQAGADCRQLGVTMPHHIVLK